ncbi:MAG: hypothetical protein KGI04_04265 [Candidatus Micrarchaeota archaeon]|nr:hypothetical protein [Candidatus Micrarchaeota archaeon]
MGALQRSARDTEHPSFETRQGYASTYKSINIENAEDVIIDADLGFDRVLRVQFGSYSPAGPISERHIVFSKDPTICGKVWRMVNGERDMLVAVARSDIIIKDEDMRLLEEPRAMKFVLIHEDDMRRLDLEEKGPVGLVQRGTTRFAFTHNPHALGGVHLRN